MIDPPWSFSLIALKRQKILPKCFYDIVSSSFAVILAKRYHPQRGYSVLSKVKGGGGGVSQLSLRLSLYFSMGKKNSEVFTF